MARTMAGAILTLIAAQSVGAQGWRDPDIPVIEDVTAPTQLRVGTAGEVRLTYRARQANVVAVVQVIEDLEGPVAPRSTRQREFGVIADVFGFEAGELTVPLSFRRPGRKRVTLTLVTDGREASEPVIVHVEATP